MCGAEGEGTQEDDGASWVGIRGEFHDLFDEVFGLFWLSESGSVNAGGGRSDGFGLGSDARLFDQLAELGFHLGQFGGTEVG